MPIPFGRLVALLAVMTLAASIRPGRADDGPPRKGAKLDSGMPSLVDRLSKRVAVEKFEGKFVDAVKVLRETYDLPVVIDASSEKALRAVEDGAEKVTLPKMASVRTDTLLQLVCQQGNAMYLVYPDHIRIVHEANGLYESGVLKQPDPTNPNEEAGLLSTVEMQKARPLTQRALVTEVFRDRPLAEILAVVAESTGANVVLAPQAADKARLPLSVRFANTPVEAAVRTLVEMADLGVIEDANVLIVTTPERAAARAKAEEQKRKARQPAAAMGGLVGTGLGGVPVVPAELAGELARLKEQNEQLKKQLDEIHTLLKK